MYTVVTSISIVGGTIYRVRSQVTAAVTSAIVREEKACRTRLISILPGNPSVFTRPRNWLEYQIREYTVLCLRIVYSVIRKTRKSGKGPRMRGQSIYTRPSFPPPQRPGYESTVNAYLRTWFLRNFFVILRTVFSNFTYSTKKAESDYAHYTALFKTGCIFLTNQILRFH